MQHITTSFSEGDLVVIKVGSESIGNQERMSEVVKTIVELMRRKIRVILVSSGAVMLGKKVDPIMARDFERSTGGDRNILLSSLASLGQTPLMQGYVEAFGQHSINVAQILTHHALLDGRGDLNHFKGVILTLLRYGNLPILNENDAVSVFELLQLAGGKDNDQNAGLIATLFRARAVILVTNTDGVFENAGKGKKIDLLSAENITGTWLDTHCGGEKSNAGTGGMRSKLEVAKKFVEETGSEVLVTNGTSTGTRITKKT